MLNVEDDIRNKQNHCPFVGLHDPLNEDIEAIPFVSPNLTVILRIKNKAEAARQRFIDDTEMNSGVEYFADVEYNNALKYWIVVYSLSLDDQPAYITNGQQWVEDYVKNKLGSKFYGAYESLAIEILEESGIELKYLTSEEVESEVDFSISTMSSEYPEESEDE